MVLPLAATVPVTLFVSLVEAEHLVAIDTGSVPSAFSTVPSGLFDVAVGPDRSLRALSLFQQSLTRVDLDGTSTLLLSAGDGLQVPTALEFTGTGTCSWRTWGREILDLPGRL